MPFFKNKSFIIAIITIVVVGVLVAVLLLNQQTPTVGEAYRISGTTTDITDNAVYFDPASGFAAPGDEDIEIPIKLKVSLGDTFSEITLIQFCLNYPWEKFDVVSLDYQLGSYAVTPDEGNAATYLAGSHDESDQFELCPSGYTAKIELLSGTAGTPLTTGTHTLGILKLKVSDSAAYSTQTPEKINLVTTTIGGTSPENTDTFDYVQKSSSTDITIVPTCPDGDGDGFPAVMALDGFVVGADYRACASYNAISGNIEPAFDCDDEDGARFPLNQEVCDGLDNNCDLNNYVDENLSGSQPNSKQKGVCVGQKLCLGSYPLIDSYLVPTGEQGTIKLDTNLNDFVTFFKGSEKIYNFEVYAANETACGLNCCDGLDNDCDGSIDEGLVGCTLGLGAEPSLVGTPPGNIFIEYDTDTTEAKLVQELQSRDAWLQNVMYLMYEQNSPDTCGTDGPGSTSNCCGFFPHLPCEYAFANNQQAHICRDGTYYIEFTNNNNIFKMGPHENINLEATIETCPEGP